jgi:hypothetical protein
MKLSLIAAAAITASLAAGCSVTDADKQAAPKPADTTAPNDTAPPRTLVDGKALPTTPVNLLADPGFSLVGREQGYGSFLAFYENSREELELGVTLDSRSPAGFGGAVALVRPKSATDTRSRSAVLLTTFLGGTGPFQAKLWVSKSNVAGEPVELPTDGSAVRASVMNGTPDSDDAFDLTVEPDTTRTIGGRTWVLLSAAIAGPLGSGGFLVIRTGTKGGHIHLAAPEITSDELTIGQAVRSRSNVTFAAPRAKSAEERAAIRAYRSIPPRLLPAAPRPQLDE